MPLRANARISMYVPWSWGVCHCRLLLSFDSVFFHLNQDIAQAPVDFIEPLYHGEEPKHNEDEPDNCAPFHGFRSECGTHLRPFASFITSRPCSQKRA